MRSDLLDAVRGWVPDDPDTRRAVALLGAWDGRFVEDSAGASVAVLAWRELDGMGFRPKPPWDARARVAWAAAFLREHHGRVDVPLGELQRLRHGDVDLPLGGGPDTLHCTYGHLDGGHLVGDQGDSYVLLAEWGPDGLRASSIHQYGASLRPDSPHHSDQAERFVRRELKPLALDRATLAREAERIYHPGEAASAR